VDHPHVGFQVSSAIGLAVDREADRATYLEPNVWMIHNLSSVQNYEVPQ